MSTAAYCKTVLLFDRTTIIRKEIANLLLMDVSIVPLYMVVENVMGEKEREVLLPVGQSLIRS